jgi:dynein heavy chain
MYSSEGEYVNYLTIVDTNAANGNVDQWLLWTEGSMVESVKDVTTKSFQDYTKIKRKEWVKNRCGMSVLSISMTYWTYNSETAIQGEQDSLDKYIGKLNSDLEDIV